MENNRPKSLKFSDFLYVKFENGRFHNFGLKIDNFRWNRFWSKNTIKEKALEKIHLFKVMVRTRKRRIKHTVFYARSDFCFISLVHLGCWKPWSTALLTGIGDDSFCRQANIDQGKPSGLTEFFIAVSPWFALLGWLDWAGTNNKPNDLQLP